MRKKLILLFLILSFYSINAQELVFSDSAKVSLITCSPGKEVYEKFGHTAIRINDHQRGIDVVFNYGIFSFETANFYYKFIKGETDYELGVYDTSNFLASYAARNSIVWEQILNLTPAERTNLIHLLLENYKPENRIYRYNFIFDNCATRPYDKIQESLKGYIIFPSSSESKTFRQWIGVYVGTDTWLKFGIDIVFGMDADRFASLHQSLFLPETLMSEMQTAQINIIGNKTKNLILERKKLIDNNEMPESNSFSLFKPLSISIILLIFGFIITIWDWFRHRHLKILDSLLFILTGFGGFIIFYLTFFSIHPLVKMNLNILWLNPLNLFVGILVWLPKFRKIIFYYEIFNIILLFGALIAFALSIQIFNIAVFPLLVLLLIRSTSWFDYLKRKIIKRKSMI
jgi:hypothetical protein